MNHIDPMPYILSACVLGFAFGFLAAYLRSRSIIRRYERSYGSLIARTR